MNPTTNRTRNQTLSALAWALLVGLPRVCAAGSECPAPPLALGRPHIDFVPWQRLPSRVLGPSNSLPGVKATALSYDAQGTRAVTVIFEFPPGWVMDKPHYVNSDQEFFVLSGRLQVDDTVYGAGDYAYLPAGLPHRVLRSETGATLLNFYEGEHLAVYAATPAGLYQPGKLIRKIESSKRPWKTAQDGSQHKLLRRDRSTGEETWLVKVATSAKLTNGRAAPTMHDAVEEFFLIDGEVSTTRGVMLSGAYAWRAPHTDTGPSITVKGYTALLRSKGGAPGGTAAGETAEVAVDAPYSPCIPETMKNALTPR